MAVRAESDPWSSISASIYGSGLVLGEFLFRIRERAGYSQAQLAAVSRVSQPNISAYEAGHRTPTAETLNRLVVACGFQLAAIAGDGEGTVVCDRPVEPLQAGVLEDPSLPRLVVEIDRLLDELDLPHAFGGALALAHWAQPRATSGIDINVFAPFSRARVTVRALAAHGFQPEQDQDEWQAADGVGLARAGERGRINLFFSAGPAHEEVAARVRRLPYGIGGQVELGFLSAEDLMVYKVLLGRPKDWQDVESMLDANPRLDLGYVERKALELRGPTMRPRLVRLARMARLAV